MLTNITQSLKMDQILIKVIGRVQGVNVRRRLVSYCKANEINGYVQSMEDGSITILGQATRSKLEGLLLWCQSPGFPAKVIGMSFHWQELDEGLEEFGIKRTTGVIQDQMNSFYNLGREVIKEELLSTKDSDKVPSHVVIIADGNRRWAKQNGLKAWMGHWHATSSEHTERLFHSSKDSGVKYLSLWAFSTENWKRGEKEVGMLFNVIRRRRKQLLNMLLREKVRFRHIGRKDRLPADVLEQLQEYEELTKDFSELNFQLCMDYNGRDDLVRAFNKMLQADVKQVDESTVSQYLDTKEIPAPDLIIRTSGEKRTSGIMAYEGAYAELYFTDVLFPDFDGDDFKLALLDYAARNRRFGGSSSLQREGIQSQGFSSLMGNYSVN